MKYRVLLVGHILPHSLEGYTTNLAEHTQAVLGKPESTKTQLAIRVKWYYKAHLGFDLSIQVSALVSMCVPVKGAFIA